MTDSSLPLEFPFGRHKLVVSFTGGQLSSDGGLLLLKQVDEQLGLTARLAGCIRDQRDPSLITHSVLDLLRQRVFGIACGYEDCNDFEELRRDGLFKLAIGRKPLTGEDLGSQPTLSRLENMVDERDLIRMSYALVDGWVERYRKAPPRRITIDIDVTDDPAHGQQELVFYNGFYDAHCYLPLLFHLQADSGQKEFVAAVLRGGKAAAKEGAVSVLRRIVGRLRQVFPKAKLLLRGDAGFAAPEVYNYSEAARLQYVLSLPKNSRLLTEAAPLLEQVRTLYGNTGEKVKRYSEFLYAADSWPAARRVIVKAEVMPEGENPRFVVTNLPTRKPKAIYRLYTDRGDVENRIKELKNDLKSGRTSCHRFLANQFRLLLHGAAFVLLQGLQRLLAGTELAAAQAETLRNKLLKVAARVRQTIRHIWVELPTNYPYQPLWEMALTKAVT